MNSKRKKLNLKLLAQEYHKYEQQPQAYILQRLPSDAKLSSQKIRNILMEISENYEGEQEGVYYHNITHAFDVTSTMDRFILSTKLMQHLNISNEERVLYLIVAYAHDVGHQGFTNDYYINSNHELALTYLYMSPLENMHASKLMRILHKHQLDISISMKRRLVSMILATDNALHFKKIKKIANLAQTYKNGTINYKDHQDFILKCLLHAADIGNPLKDFELFSEWTHCIQSQFLRQKSIQTLQPIKQVSHLQKVSQQLLFTDHIVLPFYRQLSNLLHQFKEFVEIIEQNILRLTTEQSKAKKQESENEKSE